MTWREWAIKYLEMSGDPITGGNIEVVLKWARGEIWFSQAETDMARDLMESLCLQYELERVSLGKKYG